MHLEIEAAVDFVKKILSLKKTLHPQQLSSLGTNLVGLLRLRYEGHWYPDNPDRGQAYRCIRINSWQYVDDSLLQACTLCGIEYSKIGLPKEMTVWIDPFQVCARFDEDGGYFTVATFNPDVTAEPDQCYAPPETSDYSSEGPSSESVSEASDDEVPEEMLTITNVCCIPPICKSPDEAIECPSASTPVDECFGFETKYMSLDVDGTVANNAGKENSNFEGSRENS